MDATKLNKLKEQVRIGGKGTVRRKHKVQHKNAAGNEKQVSATLKKLGVQSIPGIEEVNMFKDDGKIIHFANPKVGAAINANTFCISGNAEDKKVEELLPSILNQLGQGNVGALQKILSTLGQKKGAADAADDDVPALVENFDATPKPAAPAATEAKPAAAEAKPAAAATESTSRDLDLGGLSAGGAAPAAAPAAAATPAPAAAAAAAPAGDNDADAKAALAKVPKPAIAAVGDAEALDAARLFKKLDKSGDGSVSRDEMTEGLVETFKARGLKDTLVKRIVSMQFDVADKDKSGSLGLTEFLSVWGALKKEAKK